MRSWIYPMEETWINLDDVSIFASLVRHLFCKALEIIFILFWLESSFFKFTVILKNVILLINQNKSRAYFKIDFYIPTIQKLWSGNLGFDKIAQGANCFEYLPVPVKNGCLISVS